MTYITDMLQAFVTKAWGTLIKYSTNCGSLRRGGDSRFTNHLHQSKLDIIFNK